MLRSLRAQGEELAVLVVDPTKRIKWATAVRAATGSIDGLLTEFEVTASRFHLAALYIRSAKHVLSMVTSHAQNVIDAVPSPIVDNELRSRFEVVLAAGILDSAILQLKEIQPVLRTLNEWSQLRYWNLEVRSSIRAKLAHAGPEARTAYWRGVKAAIISGGATVAAIVVVLLVIVPAVLGNGPIYAGDALLVILAILTIEMAGVAAVLVSYMRGAQVLDRYLDSIMDEATRRAENEFTSPSRITARAQIG